MPRPCTLLPLCLALGCASVAGPRPGTGDVSFRLTWDGEADLDLRVTDPTGAAIDFYHRTSESGGRLDIDCNADVAKLCAEPIENVYWPADLAPAGSYEVHVLYFNPGPSGIAKPVSYTLLVLRGEQLVERHPGVLAAPGEQSDLVQYIFRRDDAAVTAHRPPRR